jgi:hypothetical protein
VKVIISGVAIIVAGAAIYIMESKPPASRIVAMFANQGGNPEKADVRDITAWLMRPAASGLRNQINVACAPLVVNPKVDWMESTEAKVCQASAEATRWSDLKPTPRDGFGLKSWP